MLAKTKFITVLSLVCSYSLPSVAEDNEKMRKDNASYSIGVNLGKQLEMSRDDVNLDKFIEGLKDAYAGRPPRLTPEQMQQALASFREIQKKKALEKQQSLANRNLQEGEAFLAANKKKKGVTTLPSGLQYQVIRKGKGASPTASDTVVTHYHGTLIDGTVFDSSVDRGQPATFPVSRVINGWTEALQKMKVGDKWKIFVPSRLAYGATGAGNKIGPNTALIFDIELLKIKK